LHHHNHHHLHHYRITLRHGVNVYLHASASD